jgi:hypothetical protein
VTWNVNRDEVVRLTSSFPKTECHKRVSRIVAEEIEEGIRRKEFVTYEHLAKVTGLNNRRHKSLVNALYAKFLDDVLAGTPIGGCIVIGDSGEPGLGLGRAARSVGLLADETEWKPFWLENLHELGYRELPDATPLRRLKLPPRLTPQKPLRAIGEAQRLLSPPDADAGSRQGGTVRLILDIPSSLHEELLRLSARRAGSIEAVAMSFLDKGSTLAKVFGPSFL